MPDNPAFKKVQALGGCYHSIYYLKEYFCWSDESEIFTGLCEAKAGGDHSGKAIQKSPGSVSTYQNYASRSLIFKTPSGVVLGLQVTGLHWLISDTPLLKL